MTEIIKEYAEALFSLAMETGEEEAYGAALDTVRTVLAENPDYRELLSSPAIPKHERTQAVDAAFADKLPVNIVSLLALLCEKNRIADFDGCVEEYHRLVRVKNAVVTAKVTSAVPLTEEEQLRLRQSLEKKSGKSVQLSCQTDPSLLGGVVVEMDGVITDGSLRHRLREIKGVISR